MFGRVFRISFTYQELRDGPDGRVLEGFAQGCTRRAMQEITARGTFERPEHLIHWLGRKGERSRRWTKERLRSLSII